MVKRILFAVIAVFITWSVFEIIMHFVILIDTYQATHYQWRMMGEMKSRLLLFIGLIAAACFVCIYALLVNPKSPVTGLKYGFIFGLGTGVMRYSMYCFMPIPQDMALIWFIGSLVEACAGGLLTGIIVTEKAG